GRKAACPAGETTLILLKGAPTSQIAVEGSWEILATDGTRLALARLDERAHPTGELRLVGLDGRRSGTKRPAGSTGSRGASLIARSSGRANTILARAPAEPSPALAAARGAGYAAAAIDQGPVRS